MKEKQTGLFENGLIWFGAAVSVAEILTGTYLAPLGFAKGMVTIFIGHIIGCAILYVAGVIGGNLRRSAMETTKYSFGANGGKFFAILNVLQLVGWLAILIYDGAISAASILGRHRSIWCIIIGLLIILWVAVGVKNLGKLNSIAMILLLVLTILLCWVIFKGNSYEGLVTSSMTFSAAVELSVAMPLSWMPVISDYTCRAKEPNKASLVSALVYGIASCWMYVIGMGAAIYTNQSDIAQILLKAGLGAVGLIIVVFSTVTTNFIAAHSSGVSFKAIFPKIKEKPVSILMTALATLAAILFPMDDISDFLYLIGSVFAPMIAILMADYFVIKKDHSKEGVNLNNLILWGIGFVIYRLLMQVEFPCGNTLVDLGITFALAVVVNKIRSRKKEA